MSNSGLMSANLPPAWRSALAALLIVLVTVFVLFNDTLLSMVAVWIKNDTYAHGFIVAPISLWLIYRNRDQFLAVPPKSWYPGLFFLGIFGFVWLLGQLAEVNVVPQFSLVFLVIFSIITILGWQAAKTIAFPLIFLLFAHGPIINLFPDHGTAIGYPPDFLDEPELTLANIFEFFIFIHGTNSKTYIDLTITY